MYTMTPAALIQPGDLLGGNPAVRFVAVNVLPDTVLVTVTNGRDTWSAVIPPTDVRVIR